MTKMALFKNGLMVSRKFLLLLAVRYLKQEKKKKRSISMRVQKVMVSSECENTVALAKAANTKSRHSLRAKAPGWSPDPAASSPGRKGETLRLLAHLSHF